MAHIVERIKLTQGSADYKAVSDLFSSNNCNSDSLLQIQSIESVQNDGIAQKFKEREVEYKTKFGHVRVVQLWHGTKTGNIASILKNNFDVNRHGQNVGHRFGAGVSFSAFSKYASHYSDKGVSGSMVLCKVLVSNILEVEENRGQNAVLQRPPHIPGCYPLRYDTTAKNKHTMDVIVKFDRDSFLPTHVVNFRRTAPPQYPDDYYNFRRTAPPQYPDDYYNFRRTAPPQYPDDYYDLDTNDYDTYEAITNNIDLDTNDYDGYNEAMTNNIDLDTNDYDGYNEAMTNNIDLDTNDYDGYNEAMTNNIDLDTNDYDGYNEAMTNNIDLDINDYDGYNEAMNNNDDFDINDYDTY